MCPLCWKGQLGTTQQDTDVFDTTGNKIGEVKDVVLEKTSNNIMFAVVGFGGFLGMGERFHPVPWSELDYSEDRDAMS